MRRRAFFRFSRVRPISMLMIRIFFFDLRVISYSTIIMCASTNDVESISCRNDANRVALPGNSGSVPIPHSIQSTRSNLNSFSIVIAHSPALNFLLLFVLLQ